MLQLLNPPLSTFPEDRCLESSIYWASNLQVGSVYYPDGLQSDFFLGVQIISSCYRPP